MNNGNNISLGKLERFVCDSCKTSALQARTVTVVVWVEVVTEVMTKIGKLFFGYFRNC